MTVLSQAPEKSFWMRMSFFMMWRVIIEFVVIILIIDILPREKFSFC